MYLQNVIIVLSSLATICYCASNFKNRKRILDVFFVFNIYSLIVKSSKRPTI